MNINIPAYYLEELEIINEINGDLDKMNISTSNSPCKSCNSSIDSNSSSTNTPKFLNSKFFEEGMKIMDLVYNEDSMNSYSSLEGMISISKN